MLKSYLFVSFNKNLNISSLNNPLEQSIGCVVFRAISGASGPASGPTNLWVFGKVDNVLVEFSNLFLMTLLSLYRLLVVLRMRQSSSCPLRWNAVHYIHFHSRQKFSSSESISAIIFFYLIINKKFLSRHFKIQIISLYLHIYQKK